MQYIFRPIDEWPGEQTRNRAKSQFSATWGKTIELLDRELGRLKAQNVVLQADVLPSEIRLDGMLYAGAKPRTPRIILSFDSKHGPLSYPCDQFSDWQANVRAIALSLEALRSVDRYGVTRRAEQYKGWERLPAPKANGQQAAAVLAKYSGMAPSLILAKKENAEIAYRAAARVTHPDAGGRAEWFKEVADAWEILKDYA